MNKRILPGLFSIRDAAIWNESEILDHCDVIVDSGWVKSIDETGDPDLPGELIDGSGLVLLPSGVDAHVHLRVPGQPHKELPETALLAAIHGGYGAVLNMPNTKPVIDSVEVCELAMKDMRPAMADTGIEVFLSAAISRGLRGASLVDVDALAEWGVKTFTDDGLGVESDDLMLQVFKAASKWNVPVSQHAEFKGHGGVLSEGNTQRKLNILPYPDAAEYKMVERDLSVLHSVPSARYHVLHVSLSRTVELVTSARAAGFNVSCEVTPHHLFYSSDDVPENDTSFKMNPPLRAVENKKALCAALSHGEIDFVATDHAPHSDAEKGNDFSNAAFGTTGMETSLRVLLELLHRQMIDEKKLVRSFSSSPARYLGIEDRFGHIAVGKPLNAILIDPDFRPERIAETDLVSKGKNNIFKGIVLPGRIYHLFNKSFAFKIH